MSELFSSESGSERVSIGTVPTMTSQEAAFPLRRVGPGFILAYVIAYFGAWIAFLTPIVVALAIRIQQIDPAGKVGDIALITGVGAVFGFFSSPFFGKMSDRTASRCGLRISSLRINTSNRRSRGGSSSTSPKSSLNTARSSDLM